MSCTICSRNTIHVTCEHWQQNKIFRTMLKECVAAFGSNSGKRLLVKNRDKAYKPTLDFYHELRDGTEVLYYIDEAVKHLEGMNEHGLGVLYTTSNFQADHADIMTDNVSSVLNALTKKTAEEALQPLTQMNGGVHGLIFVSGPDGTHLIEHNVNTGGTEIKKIDGPDGWNVITNSPSMLAGGIDPAAGEDYISCQIRKAVAEAALYGIDDLEAALDALSYKYFADDSHHNPMRSSDFETTCAQLGFDLDSKKCFFTPVPNALEGKTFKKQLPPGYEPKIEFVERSLSEPVLAPFKLFTTNIDESITKFNLVNYLLDDGPERELQILDNNLQQSIEKASRLELAQKAADQLWEKERLLVSLIRKLEKDPVFFTAGHTSTQVQNELDMLHKMVNKIGKDYEQLLNVIHIERYGSPMPMLMDEADKRKPRKKGQHTGSSSHSDLYTDENPKGTIKGLKFATVKDAETSVNKIKKSGKSHAHKIQAAVAMEQRAKAADKPSAAGVYRSYINSQKKDESLVRDYIRALLEFSIKANRKNVHQDGTSKSRGYMSGIDKTWTGEDTNDHLHSWYKKMGLMSEALLTESDRETEDERRYGPPPSSSAGIDPKMMQLILQADDANYHVDVSSDVVRIYDGSKNKIAAVSWYEAGIGPTFGPCLKGAIVNHSDAVEDMGPLAYDVAIEVTGGLMSDRTEVSDEAERVWDYYMNNRSDVQSQQLDIMPDYGVPQLTPRNKGDDCDQIPAHTKYGDKWHESGLSKKFSKQGTPVMDELRRRGMLNEK